MNNTALAVETILYEAKDFAQRESRHRERSLYGVTDGKAVGTYLEHKFQALLHERYSYAKGSSAKSVDGIPYYTWRSGVKHDAAGIMELERDHGQFTNGKHEVCRLETTYLFPLLKSSDVANGRIIPTKYVLLTQRKPSDDTDEIKKTAPKTWAYLTEHAAALDHRRSIIYEKRPRFSIFGVGNYTGRQKRKSSFQRRLDLKTGSRSSSSRRKKSIRQRGPEYVAFRAAANAGQLVKADGISRLRTVSKQRKWTWNFSLLSPRFFFPSPGSSACITLS
jgi:hypothetical protein